MKTRTNYCKYLVIYIYIYIYIYARISTVFSEEEEEENGCNETSQDWKIPYNNPSGFVAFLLLYMNRYDHAMRHHKIEKLTHSITLLVLLFHIYIYL